MWLEVPSLTLWTGDTLCYFAAVCLWAESPPESLSLTFLTAKWGCCGRSLGGPRCAQGWGGDSLGPCPPWIPGAGVVSPAPQVYTHCGAGNVLTSTDSVLKKFRRGGSPQKLCLLSWKGLEGTKLKLLSRPSGTFCDQVRRSLSTPVSFCLSGFGRYE